MGVYLWCDWLEWLRGLGFVVQWCVFNGAGVQCKSVVFRVFGERCGGGYGSGRTDKATLKRMVPV